VGRRARNGHEPLSRPRVCYKYKPCRIRQSIGPRRHPIHRRQARAYPSAPSSCVRPDHCRGRVSARQRQPASPQQRGRSCSREQCGCERPPRFRPACGWRQLQPSGSQVRRRNYHLCMVNSTPHLPEPLKTAINTVAPFCIGRWPASGVAVHRQPQPCQWRGEPGGRDASHNSAIRSEQTYIVAPPSEPWYLMSHGPMLSRVRGAKRFEAISRLSARRHVR